MMGEISKSCVSRSPDHKEKLCRLTSINFSKSTFELSETDFTNSNLKSTVS